MPGGDETEARAHLDMVIVPHTMPSDRFSALADALTAYAFQRPDGLPAYTIDFL